VADTQVREATDRPRLLLIAPRNSYRTLAYLESARRLGVDALVASEGKFSLVSEIADGLHVDLADPAALQALLAANRARPFTGVVATDDDAVELASRIAQALALPHNSPAAALRSRRKDLSRAALAAAGVPVPDFRLVDLTRPLAPQIEGVSLPCVVKPVALSGSRGVMRADDTDAVLRACARVQQILAGEAVQEAFSARHVLVEAFVGGPEVALEGLLHAGKLDVLAIFDKPDPLEGPYFEETYYITPSRHSKTVRARVIRRIEQACNALGLSEGPVHAEARISNCDCVIMEVAARTIGGDCARLLRFGTGQGLEDLVISHAIGNPLRAEVTPGGAGVLMIPISEAGILRRIEGITAARAVQYIEDIVISIREGYELVALPEGASYLGFMFAHAPTPAQAETALREAHAKLKIVVAPLITIGGQISDVRLQTSDIRCQTSDVRSS